MRRDEYLSIRGILHNEFPKNYEAYGYRRLHAIGKASGRTISDKVILRLLYEEGLSVRFVKKRKYSSYKGEISPRVGNLIKRDFRAGNPNGKWLSDITEFSIPTGKVYLSPVSDCLDDAAVSWTRGPNPNAELANDMLDKAGERLPEDACPIGCHYRWPGWISRMENARLVRSMSRKGCSPDNSACEGFFGRLKNEMFSIRSWSGVSIEEF